MFMIQSPTPNQPSDSFTKNNELKNPMFLIELINKIFVFADQPRLVLPFQNIMYIETTRHLLRHATLAGQIKHSNVGIVKLMANLYTNYNWKHISKMCRSDKIINAIPDKFHWNLLFKYNAHSERLIIKYLDRIPNNGIYYIEGLSNDFIASISQKIRWSVIGGSRYQLDSTFITRFEIHLDFYLVSKYQIISEYIIDRHVTDVDWPSLSRIQNFSRDFMNRHSSRIDLNIMEQYANPEIEDYDTYEDYYNLDPWN